MLVFSQRCEGKCALCNPSIFPYLNLYKGTTRRFWSTKLKKKKKFFKILLCFAQQLAHPSEQFVQRCTSHPILKSAWNEPIYPWNVQFDLHSCLLTEVPVMMTIIWYFSTFQALSLVVCRAGFGFVWLVWKSDRTSYCFPLISQIKPPLPSLAPAFLHMKDGKARELWNPADICIAHLSPHTSTFDLWILNFQIRTPIIACWTKSS